MTDEEEFDQIEWLEPQSAEATTISLSPYAIAVGLRAAAEEVPFWGDRTTLRELSDTIREGKSLDESLARQQRMPSDLKAVVEAGIKTGRLPHLLEAYLSSRQSLGMVWRKFYASLFYPVIMFALCLLVLSVFFIVVIPDFKQIFDDFGMELPRITMFVILIADLLVHFWWLMAAVFLIVAILIITERILPFRAFRSELFHLLPVVGTAQKMAAASEFCSRMSVLVDCRLPLHEALRITSQSLRDPHLASVTKKLAARLEAGETHEDIARSSRGLPNALSNSFRWARNPEIYADSLRSLAIVFSSQARAQTAQFAMLLEPLAIFAVGSIVAFTILALFMPMIKLLNELS